MSPIVVDTDAISLVFKNDTRGVEYVNFAEFARSAGVIHDRSGAGALDLPGEVRT